MRRILISMFRLPAACFAAALCASGGAATEPVADEALHVAALRAIFPGAQVSIERGKKLNLGGPNKPKPGELTFPDALADEDVIEFRESRRTNWRGRHRTTSPTRARFGSDSFDGPTRAVLDCLPFFNMISRGSLRRGAVGLSACSFI
ncbi:MAG: hypothetical protein ABSF98_15500 [Bryobacteraceae bacterium]|jgi:hypothetical protein